MSFSEETRRVDRIAVKIPVTIRVNPSLEKDFKLGQKELHLSTLNMSATGMGILSNVYVPEGVILDVEFDTQSLVGKDKENKKIKLTGEVVSVRMQGGQYRLGILIKEIDPDSKSIILKLINAV